MQPGDIIVVAFVKPQQLGQQFKEWPLHVTVLSWQRGTAPAEMLARQLSVNLQDIRPFNVEVADETGFGKTGSIRVNLVRTPTPLSDIHQTVTNVALDAGFVQVSHRYPAYRPHVTVQPKERLHSGDTFLCDHLYLVAQHGEYKSVEAEITL